MWTYKDKKGNTVITTNPAPKPARPKRAEDEMITTSNIREIQEKRRAEEEARKKAEAERKQVKK